MRFVFPLIPAKDGVAKAETEPAGVRRASPGWRLEALAVVALVGVAMVHVAMLLAGHWTYFTQPDNSGQFWPWYQKEATALHSGAFALWDANSEAGHSFVGEIQTGVFYPLNVVWLLVLGGAHGIGTRRLDLLVVVHLLIASTGFYALSRSFGIRRLHAVIAAVVFAYTGVVFARTVAQTAIFFGLTLVPWAVFFAHRHLETGRLRFAVGAGVAIGLGVLAGHFQPPFHAALLVVLFYALTGRRPDSTLPAEVRSRLKGVVATFVAAGIVALPQLLYTVPYLNRAYRFTGPGPPTPPGGSVSFQAFSEAFSAEPSSILNLLDPQRYTVPDSNELFIGLAALVVLVTGLVVFHAAIRAQLGRYLAPLAGAAIVGGLAMLGPWTPFPRILYNLPLVAEVRELARYSIMLQLVLCLLLAFSLQAISQGWSKGDRATRVRRGRVTAILGTLLALDGIYLLINHAPESTGWLGVQVLLGAFALLVLAAGAQRAQVFPVSVLLGLLIVGGSLHNGARVLGSTSSPLYPQHVFARTPVITYVENACAEHRTLLLDESLPRNIGDVFPRIRTQNGYGATLHVPFFDFISSSSWTSLTQTRLLDLRCIVAASPLAIPGYRVGFQDTTLGITVYIDDQTSPINTPQLQPIPVKIVAVEDRRLLYEVDLSHQTTVVVSAIVYPGWHVSVDGRSVSTGSFRVGTVPVFPQVTLPAGRHTLEYSWSGWPL